MGLPKTGTTYLQTHVFPALRETAYLDKPTADLFTGDGDAGYGLLDGCFKRSAVVWRERGGEVLDALLPPPAGLDGKARVLVSDEGVGTAGRRPHLLRAHLEELAHVAGTRGLAPLRVLCTVRRQDQWLGSHYAQISDRITGASQETFERYVCDLLDPAREYYRRGVLLDYRGLREQLVRAVGEAHVLMLPYELLDRDPRHFIGRVAAFLETDVDREAGLGEDPERENVRSARPDVWAIRPRSPAGARELRLRPERLWSGLGLPSRVRLRLPERGRGDVLEMTEALRARVRAVYRASNVALAADLGLDLGTYGYY